MKKYSGSANSLERALHKTGSSDVRMIVVNYFRMNTVINKKFPAFFAGPAACTDGIRVLFFLWYDCSTQLVRTECGKMEKTLMSKCVKLMQYHDLIAAIVTAMETRDPYTECHSMRVADMVQQLCTCLLISEEESMVIHIAAHLHDIGKIGIDDKILRKTGSLDDEEWNSIKSHSVLGYTILHKVETFSEISEIVLHHHERWDGGGYPSGIQGKAIPYGSRIIAVADSIDAMMSRRSYRTGLTAEQCRTEIENNAGKMYDPEIVRTVLIYWDRIVECRNDFGISQVEDMQAEYSAEGSEMIWNT
jgi:putative nucleotidyltransferase with HDIG domain